ncbi:MAG: extracellular solute-binding protein [Limnochordales bacterium]|nr:extracellular solute-binding protein [Limnochordales bacterium]
MSLPKKSVRLILNGTFIVLMAAALLVMPAIPGMAKTKLTLWDWHEPRVKLFEEYARLYEKVRPDVEIDVVTVPWNEYWSKLTVAIVSKTPPDIAEFHNEQYSNFDGMLTPFPEDLFPLEEMRKKYIMFDQAFNFDGKFYYFPDGIMTGVIFYNVDLLNQAGIAGVPATWDDMIVVGQKLTRRNLDGTVRQIGFNFANDAGVLVDMIYQYGGRLFGEKGVAFHEDPGKKAVQLFDRLLKARISVQPGVEFSGNFENGQIAMQYTWTHYGGYLRNVSKIHWEVAPLPTVTGGNLPARGRNNYECGLSVPVGVPKDRQRLAFEFIKWLYDNDEFYIRLNQALGRIPGRPSLWSRPEVMKNSMFRVLAQQVPYTVYAGPIPGWMWETIGILHQDLINGTKSPMVALEEARQRGDAGWRQYPPKYIVEHKYRPPAN